MFSTHTCTFITIYVGCEGLCSLFFLRKIIFDEVAFYFIRDFIAPQSDAGGHLDL